MKISEDIKKFIEDNPVFIGSATKEGLPNITIIDGAKFLDNQRILIVDVQMTSCRDNLIANPSCCYLSIIKQWELDIRHSAKRIILPKGKSLRWLKEISKIRT